MSDINNRYTSTLTKGLNMNQTTLGQLDQTASGLATV